MVKVKRVVSLEDKNVGDEEIECIVETKKSQTPAAKSTKGSEDGETAEERRSTRKIKKKRHKYDENDDDDDEFDFGDNNDFSRSTTPVRGMKAVKRNANSTKKTLYDDFSDVKEAVDTLTVKRPRRSLNSSPVTPMEGLSPIAVEKKPSVPGTPSNETQIEVANLETVKEETPPIPKETVTFKAGACNPAGLQTFFEFLLRVLRRKDSSGYFAHPPTETLCPRYFSVIEVPMDFDLIQQKFDNGLYVDLLTFRGDLMLLFENAMRYFDSATVIYHAARRLRHFVRKITGKEKLLGMKLAFPALLAGIGIEELGLDEAELTETGNAARDDEGNLVVEVDQETDHDEDMKIEWVRMEREDRSGGGKRGGGAGKVPEKPVARKPLNDAVSTQEVLTTWMSQVGGAGRKATPITKKKNSMLIRQGDDGLTTMTILNPDNAAVPVDANGEAAYRPEASEANAAVSLKQTLGRVGLGSGGVATFKEDRRNFVKPVKYIDKTAFCSFGPSYDSRFANLSKNDSDDLISAFHEESDLKFVKDIKTAIGRANEYEIHAVDGLLDALTGGQHLDRADVAEDRKRFEQAEEKFRRFAATRAEGDDGDVIVLDGDAKESEAANPVDDILRSNADKIRSLRDMQNSRLSRAPPPHLALVNGPPEEEFGLANHITDQLSSLAKKVTPKEVVSRNALFKALGVDLEKYAPSPMEAPTAPFAKEDVPRNIFDRSFSSGFSFLS